jgi:hypothetical protein
MVDWAVPSCNKEVIPSSCGAVQQLCATPQFASLETLRLESTKLDAGGVKALVKAWTMALPGTFLPCLRIISLNGNYSLEHGIMELIGSWEVGLSPVLEELDLRGCGLRHGSLM